MKHALIACSRVAGILTLVVGTVFMLHTQAAFGEMARVQSSSYGSSSPIPPLIAAPRPPALPARGYTTATNHAVTTTSAKAVKAAIAESAATPTPSHLVPATLPTPVAAQPTPVVKKPEVVPVATPAAKVAPARQPEAAHTTEPAPVEEELSAGQAAHPVAAKESEPPESVDSAAGGVTASVYHIGVDDVLNVSVWQEPDLSRTVPVRPDGKISLPLVGDVTAAGKTAMQLQGELKLALSKFVRNPELTVIVVDIRSRRVNVMGQVAKPGMFPLTQSMGVLEALAAAGGLRDFAKKKDIYVLRMSPDGKRERIPYPYDAILKGKAGSREVMLQPRDTVVVP